MATTIYEAGNIELIDGTNLYITPLKIKYLRQFMIVFDTLKKAKSDDEVISILVDCTRVAMQQYMPSIRTPEDVEDNLDLAAMYKVIKIAANIDMQPESDQEKDSNSKQSDSGQTWEDVDLASLEAEVFLLGIWKDYEELETSLSMPELTKTLDAKREADYADKKFMAAIQGVDLDKNTGKPDAWEEMKARVFSGGKASNSNDILSLQGANATKAGFGIGLGLSYEDLG